MTLNLRCLADIMEWECTFDIQESTKRNLDGAMLYLVEHAAEKDLSLPNDM